MLMRKFIMAVLVFPLLAQMTLAQAEFWKWEWPNTDFENASVPFIEIESGGPQKDGIPAIDNPVFLPVSEEDRLSDIEPVMTVEMEGVTRAYPIRYLMFHEIVNDRINDIPISVTFCPLCNSGITFDGRLDGKELTFGVSGKLRHSDMVMYDRQTESWWQQFIGQGIVGDLNGKTLTKIPSWMESWQDFKARNPNGEVLDEPKFRRQYGTNPYALYDTANRPFLFRGEDPPHGIKPLARVVVLEDRAWPLERVAKEGAITEGGVTISWKEGLVSALDKYIISASRDVGAIRVKDAATGKDLPHDIAFAFAFHAFHPEGQWMLGSQ